MDRAFEVILEAVHRYEGTINQFLGDGVMALFGAPIAHEDHAHRALGAALAIQEGLGPLRDDVRRAHRVEFRQSEIMFALGWHAEHVQALEAIRHLSEHADLPRRVA